MRFARMQGGSPMSASALDATSQQRQTPFGHMLAPAYSIDRGSSAGLADAYKGLALLGTENAVATPRVGATDCSSSKALSVGMAWSLCCVCILIIRAGPAEAQTGACVWLCSMRSDRATTPLGQQAAVQQMLPRPPATAAMPRQSPPGRRRPRSSAALPAASWQGVPAGAT